LRTISGFSLVVLVDVEVEVVDANPLKKSVDVDPLYLTYEEQEEPHSEGGDSFEVELQREKKDLTTLLLGDALIIRGERC